MEDCAGFDSCQSCHRYRELYSSRIDRPEAARLDCMDCHQTVLVSEEALSNVHAPGDCRLRRRVSYATGAAQETDHSRDDRLQ